MVALPKTPPITDRMTVAEFYAWGGTDDDTFWQLIDGVPTAMAPPRIEHGLIQSQVSRLIGNHLADHLRDCRIVTTPGVVPAIRSADNVRVPDLAVTCARQERGAATLRDPVLIIEILSPSNEKETWLNIWAYTTIPSLREILVLSSVEPGAKLLRRRPDGSWPDSAELVAAADTLRLDSIDGSWALAEFYATSGLAA